jgi:hypothetical protein
LLGTAAGGMTMLLQCLQMGLQPAVAGRQQVWPAAEPASSARCRLAGSSSSFFFQQTIEHGAQTLLAPAAFSPKAG